MPSKTWSYAQSAARANATDDYYRDLGLDPLNANTAVHTPSGGSLGVGRATNRMLEGARGLAGTRTLWNAPEQNDYLALHTGSGSPQDMPGMGGTNQVMPAEYGVEAGLARLNRTASNRAYDVFREKHSAMREEDKARFDAERATGVEDIRRQRSTIGKLSPELQGVYERMSPTEKNAIIHESPEKQYAQLSSSKLRPTAPLKQTAAGYSYSGDQKGIEDFLARRGPGMPGSPDWYNPKSDRQDYPDLPVPTMKPLSATKPMTTLPQSTSKPWWVPRPLLTPF